MSNDKFENLIEQLKKVMQSGSEKETRQFLVDHMAEFPDEVRRKLTFLFFQEGLAQAASGEDKRAFDFQKSGLEAIQTVKKDTDELERKSKIVEVKESLDNKK
jgi:hypothetical protein